MEELQEGGLISGVREAVQLREQDWGNFQDPRVQAECKAERLRYGRFYYRFPSGESVADVYDRLTIFQDHLVRDMCAGRWGPVRRALLRVGRRRNRGCSGSRCVLEAAVL